ncbi:hypothetical protein JMJ77_0000251, partial [Colletotrichum scovillei]
FKPPVHHKRPVQKDTTAESASQTRFFAAAPALLLHVVTLQPVLKSI